MSKEAGERCICGQRIAFMQYHWPHCTMNPANLRGDARVAIERKFTKAELAFVEQHGGMAMVLDQPAGNPKRKRKAKTKR